MISKKYKIGFQRNVNFLKEKKMEKNKNNVANTRVNQFNRLKNFKNCLFNTFSLPSLTRAI